MPPDDRWLGVDEVAELLGISLDSAGCAPAARALLDFGGPPNRANGEPRHHELDLRAR